MNETILVVDDELSARSFARDALQAHGYTVLDTDEPQEALQILRDQPVHLLVVDVVMPLMRGTGAAVPRQAVLHRDPGERGSRSPGARVGAAEAGGLRLRTGAATFISHGAEAASPGPSARRARPSG